MKNQYRGGGGDCLKRWAWTVCWFKGGLARKRGWCFWHGGWNTNAHYSKSLWSLCDFSGYWTSTSRQCLTTVATLWLFKKFSLNWDVFSTHSKPSTGNSYNTSHPYKKFPCQYIRYNFIKIFHVFVVGFCILMNSMTYSTSETFFYQWKHISITE